MKTHQFEPDALWGDNSCRKCGFPKTDAVHEAPLLSQIGGGQGRWIVTYREGFMPVAIQANDVTDAVNKAKGVCEWHKGTVRIERNGKHFLSFLDGKIVG